MASPVDIFVKDDSVSPAPTPDVSVSVHNDTTKVMVAWGVTDADGRAAFLLPPGIYEVRLFKLGVVFPRPSRLQVTDSQDVTQNAFDLVGTLLSLPISTDPRTCRCTGRFVDSSNNPIPNVTVRISPKAEQGSQAPEVVDGDQVLGGYSKTLKTDQSGRVTVDLMRGGEYYVVWSGEDDDSWNFKVPDRASANLIELIHPTPRSASWESPTLSVAVGVTQRVILDVLFSDYQTRTAGLLKWLQLLNSNSDVCDVALEDGAVAVTGRAVGSSQVQVSARPDATPVVLGTSFQPPPPLMVTVTP